MPIEISDELYEILRIENGIPLYGVDMDETTIVPEIGLPETNQLQQRLLHRTGNYSENSFSRSRRQTIDGIDFRR